jgi:dCTP deaminase
MRELLTAGYVADAAGAKLGYSSFDLTLTDEAYKLTEGSVKPFGDNYLHQLKQQSLVEKLVPEEEIFYLKAKSSYLFKLRESIPLLSLSQIYGQATAKSSVGRMDVLARLVVDGTYEYEGFDPAHIKTGHMYLEITPMTFNVCVKAGSRLTQLRLFKGRPSESKIEGINLYSTVLIRECGKTKDNSLSVDLSSTAVANEEGAAFCASAQASGPPLNLWSPDDPAQLPNPKVYWKLVKADGRRRLQIQENNFYIIRSYEKIWLPAGVAVYCRATDETIGEMRIHYAGFVHPFFGQRDDGQRGTPLIFEVRGHDVNVSLRDQEKMARLDFYRMSKDCINETELDESEYMEQTLKLSKYFAKWS